MRITQEADYAVRICIVLDEAGKKLGASAIAEAACIPQSFALKILRKLNEGGIVRSFKGARGGYELARDGDELTILDVIEAIDGETLISKCLECDYDCSRNQKKSCCKVHIAFGAINKNLTDNLGKIKIGMINDKSITSADIADIINQVNY